jgi:hypothetical protein
MPTPFRGFCAALVLAGWGAAFALADGAPPPPGRADAPVELPGPPPLPPLAQQEPVPADRAFNCEHCSSWGGFFADGEYLYLKPYRRDLDFAIVSPNANGDPEGSIQSDPWRSRSAFRVGAGYRAPDDAWEMGFFYTYLHDDQASSAVQPPGGLLFATLTHPGTVERVAQASADATLHYNVFDLEMARPIDVCGSLAVRPFAGARFAEINQELSALYDGGDANRDFVDSRIKFEGGGVRAGGEAELKLLNRVGVYGRAAASLLTGDFRVTQTEFNNAGATPLTNVNESFRKIVPVLELGAGVAYHGEHLHLSVGYEIANWFNLVDTPSFVDDVHQGKFQRNVSDLGLDGFVVKAEIAY